MNEDPYQTPTSELGKRGRQHKRSLWWKIVFWFYIALFVLTLLALPLVGGLSVIDYFELAISIVGTVALFGFAYDKAVLTVAFWRYYFYVMLVETVVYTVVWPAAGFQRYGMDTGFDGSYVFELCFVSALIYVMYVYSHRCDFLWEKTKTD